MECKKCGKILSEQEKFCTYCGFYNDPNENDENNVHDETNNNEDYEVERVMYEDGEKLKPRCIKAYLMNDYKTVINGGFNIFALLFSWIYYIYKKMYLIGIIGLIIIGILFIYNKIVLIIYMVVSMIISGIFFNKIHLWYTKKKVDKILNNTENPKEAIRLSKKAGRENIILTLIIYFIFLIAIILLYATGGTIESQNDKFWKENGSNKATCLSMIETAKNISNTNTIAFLREAGCIVVDKPNEVYHLYLKFDKGDKIILEKYITKTKAISFEGSTDLLKEYENKKSNLNDSELGYYQEMLEIENEYQKINQQSKIEEDAIANRTNTTTRAYFIFDEKEVNR